MAFTTRTQLTLRGGYTFLIDCAIDDAQSLVESNMRGTPCFVETTSRGEACHFMPTEVVHFCEFQDIDDAE